MTARAWFRPPGLWLVTLPVILVTLLHYVTPTGHVMGAGAMAHMMEDAPGGVPMHLFHDLYRRLYYVPILSAALLWGAGGGLFTAALASLLYLPHVVMAWGALPTQRFDALVEIALYHGLGALVGSVAQTLRRQREALFRTDQLRGAGEIAAGMAHEVRNPLASIRGAAERLRKGGVADAERDTLFRILEAEIARVDGVIREFLTYARPAPLARLDADLNAVAGETVALVTPTAQKRGVVLTLAADPALPPVRMDPAKVKQALLNLVLNAVQASPDGQPVTVATRLGGRRAEVVVTDRGPGVAPDLRPSLFTPFATTKEGGTGLGLPIARQILEAHGGSVRLDPGPGGGTVAIASLPVGGP